MSKGVYSAYRNVTGHRSPVRDHFVNYCPMHRGQIMAEQRCISLAYLRPADSSPNMQGKRRSEHWR